MDLNRMLSTEQEQMEAFRAQVKFPCAFCIGYYSIGQF